MFNSLIFSKKNVKIGKKSCLVFAVLKKWFYQSKRYAFEWFGGGGDCNKFWFGFLKGVPELLH